MLSDYNTMLNLDIERAEIQQWSEIAWKFRRDLDSAESSLSVEEAHTVFSRAFSRVICRLGLYPTHKKILHTYSLRSSPSALALFTLRIP